MKVVDVELIRDVSVKLAQSAKSGLLGKIITKFSRGFQIENTELKHAILDWIFEGA